MDLISTVATLFLAGPPTLGERLEKLAPNAAGLALVEVTATEEVDERPGDGPLSLNVHFRVLKTTGATVESVRIIKAGGGHPAPGSPPWKPSGPVKLDTFKKGSRYWVAFCSQYDWKRFPQDVIAVWPEGSAPKEFDEAVRADHYAHRPQYDPESCFTHSHLVAKDGKGWTVRMERGGKLLWERRLPGRKFEGEHREGEWRLLHRDQWASSLEHAHKNPSGRYLFAETTYKLEPGNPFGLPPQNQRVTYALDADTGKTAAVWVSRMDLSPTATPSVVQYFDLKTGARRREERFDLLEHGGKAAGGAEEKWYRKLVRTFGADGRRVVTEEVFRHASTTEGSQYLPVKKP